MKTMKTLCVLMVLALALCPVMATAGGIVNSTSVEIFDEAIPLAASNTWSFSTPPALSDATEGESSGLMTVSDLADGDVSELDPETMPSVPVIDPETGEEEQGTTPNESTGQTTSESQDGSPENETETDLDEQPSQQQYNLNMAQFVPNKDYGLFGVNSKGNLVLLNDATLALGKDYTLAVRFRIDAPVQANAVYSYWLPAVLTGKVSAKPQTFSYSAGDIATCQVNGNEVRVMFTELAQQVTQNTGNVFTLTYSFKETLNVNLAGDYTGFDISMPMANGFNSFTINIQGQKDEASAEGMKPEAEPAETPAPIAEIEDEIVIPDDTQTEPQSEFGPESETDGDREAVQETTGEGAASEEAVEDDQSVGEETEPRIPLCGQEESDLHQHSDECYVATEEVEEVEEGMVEEEHTVPYTYEVNPVSVYGDPLTFHADVSGYEGADVFVQWQYNEGNGWRNAPGDSTDLTYYTEVNEVTASSDWRALLKTNNAEPANVKAQDTVSAEDTEFY